MEVPSPGCQERSNRDVTNSVGSIPIIRKSAQSRSILMIFISSKTNDWIRKHQERNDFLCEIVQLGFAKPRSQARVFLTGRLIDRTTNHKNSEFALYAFHRAFQDFGDMHGKSVLVSIFTACIIDLSVHKNHFSPKSTRIHVLVWKRELAVAAACDVRLVPEHNFRGRDWL